MTITWNRRLLAGLGTGALAVSVLGGLGVGAGNADAAEASATGSVRIYNYNDGMLINSQQWVDFTRTVSAASVVQGDTVTVSTTVTTHKVGAGMTMTLKNFQDWTPACMEYVADSGVATASNTIGGPATKTADLMDSTTIEANPGTAWGLGDGGAARSVTLTAQYKVTCAPGTHNSGGLNAWTTPSSNSAGVGGGWLDALSTGTGVANPPSNLKQSGPQLTVTAPSTGGGDNGGGTGGGDNGGGDNGGGTGGGGNGGGTGGDNGSSGSSDGSSGGSLGNLFKGLFGSS
ncbi:hypothetical protein [Gordonia aichiensis]|uniref:hypothetical protein n=1 Tax=Gordonia aichiensis TaxID=36820 RepID=UPI0032663E23